MFQFVKTIPVLYLDNRVLDNITNLFSKMAFLPYVKRDFVCKGNIFHRIAIKTIHVSFKKQCKITKKSKIIIFKVM